MMLSKSMDGGSIPSAPAINIYDGGFLPTLGFIVEKSDNDKGDNAVN